MAGKFQGVVGFAHSEKDEFGKTTEVITERIYTGDVVDDVDVDISSADKVNPDLTAGHSIRIVADGHASEHFSAVRFVEWAGALWRVTNAKNQRPRIILRLGGVYNGPRADPPDEETETPPSP